MIPIRDTIPARHTAWVVRLLVVLNVVAFGWELSRGRELDALIYRLGVVPAYWAPGRVSWTQWPGLWLSLISSQFLHGSPLHLAGNMLYLWIFGDNVEDRLGPWRFLLFYLGSGVVAAIAQLVMGVSSAVPMIGASGAIAGILGAYLVNFPSARILTLVPWLVSEFVEVPAFLFLGGWFLLQWLQAMTTIGQVADMGGVAWWAHVGGFVTGLIVGLRARPRRTVF